MPNAIDSAISGLRIAQQALSAASNNIANASTVGYTKKTLQQQNMVVNGQSVGAGALALSRTVDNALIAGANRQTALSEGYNITLKYLSRLQDFQGAPEASGSLSSQITALANTLTNLTTAPDNTTLLKQTVNIASKTTNSINNFSNLITGMRNDAESEINAAIADINQSLDAITRLSSAITAAAGLNQSIADLEDQRDTAVKNIAKYLDVTTYPAGNTLIVMTKQGEVLADSVPHKLFFQKSTILPTSYYPGGGINGLHVDSPSGNDIAGAAIGGQLGALLTLRDQTLPQYQAQMDEFAYQLAGRFEAEGVRLFTDLSGNIPANNPNVAPPLGYAGFSASIQVNNSIVADPTLIRDGTTGGTEQTGSNEVIRRLAQFAFGSYKYQQSSGTTPILGIGTLTANLPLTTQSNVIGSVNLTSYAPDLSTVPGLTLPATLTLTIGGVPQVITIGATDTPANVVSTINGFFPGAASINSLGQLHLVATSTITIADGPPGTPIGAGGIAALGLSFGATLQAQPNFQVQVGTRTPVTISIAPGDTSVQLLAKLNLIPGLTASLNGANGLLLVPTNGGDLKITDGTGGPLAALGMVTTNVPHATFQQNGLGPSGTLSTGLLANSTLQDYMSSVISAQSQDHNTVSNGQQQEASFLQTLNARNDNLSGVNIDQEMSDLIRIQSAYGAAAKMISAAQKLFDDLMRAF